MTLAAPALPDSSARVAVIPVLGPDAGRRELVCPQGLSVAEIVAFALPELADVQRRRLRVWLVDGRGELLLADPDLWPRIRPRAGVRVMIRIVPGNDTLRNVLLIAVAVAATAIGQVWVGPALATATGSALFGQIAGAVAAAGLAVAGSMLVNALIPPKVAAGQTQQSEKPLFQISSWQNSLTLDGVVPSVLGKVRIAPVFAAPSYSEIVGDDQYVRALFTFGYGRVQLSELKIKDTPLSAFDEVETEIREGLASDDPVTLYPSQVIEDGLGAELRRDRERDDAGTITGTGPVTPVARFTAGDCTEANVILHFPGGLIHYDGGGTARTASVEIRIRQRPAAGGDWEEVETITFSAKKREGFFRQYRWTLPERGRYEIEMARITDEAIDANTSDRVVWLALQSFRPEYPLNFGPPLSLVAVRVKATYQLNSSLESFNAVAERLIPDWDHETQSWVTRATRNPASHFRHVLQGPENTWAEPDSAIDLQALTDWHDFCRIKGLKYDRDRNFEASTFDALAEIAAAGRASPRYDGTRWSVVVDRPSELVIAHVNSRNSRDFAWRRSYIEPPDAFRVRFLDETADYQQRERIVRWPGHAGDITVTEELELPGKTDPDEIWIEARRRQYEAIHRPDIFTAVQDGAVRTATRGDLVKASYEVLKRTFAALRVTAVRGQTISLDGWVEMEAGGAYAVRFMKQVGSGDAATFQSVLRTVRTDAGTRDSLTLSGAGDMPEAGVIVQFGEAGAESLDLVIAGVQAGEQMSNVLTMLAAAPIIDTLTDAEVPPAWNGRAGGDAAASVAVPAVPVVSSIETHFTGATADGLTVLLVPGTGGATPATYTLRHRISGGVTWSEASVPAGGAIVVTGYADGDTVEIQRRATSKEGYVSAWSATVSADVAAEPVVPPLPITTGTVTGGVEEAAFGLSTPNDPSIAKIALSYSAYEDGASSVAIVTFEAAANSNYTRTEAVPSGAWFFFARTLTADDVVSPVFALGGATVD
ncbi:host specificity protein J [Polymorphum gilvum]|uniref:Tail fiber protein n=1 Tax=Polymorphum gilvum (strain LMG 25793 / CGMCC 1.9160 / SL003B-26A1) TaxID=991905 RepID=F2J5P6_POLGS|nr:tail fiber protein [Polymorphum gilvum]ADZ70130.1 Tail fiber protein [Polymorphum gilvum SL003B-26A1]